MNRELKRLDNVEFHLELRETWSFIYPPQKAISGCFFVNIETVILICDLC